MKPKLKEWIPMYGLVKYENRFFDDNEKYVKNLSIAQWFVLYHGLITVAIVVSIIISTVLTFVK